VAAEELVLSAEQLAHHPGRETFGASVYAARKGGTIVTCASTSGYMHQYDNRYMWMNLKSIVGSHFANYRESWEANRLIAKGMIHPTLSRAYPLEDVGQAARSTSTRTPTRARSASSAWLPRKASASATTSSAPSTSTRSTASTASTIDARHLKVPSEHARLTSVAPADCPLGRARRIAITIRRALICYKRGTSRHESSTFAQVRMGHSVSTTTSDR